MEQKIKSAGRKGSVLNLFAYTGGATIATARKPIILYIVYKQKNVENCKKTVVFRYIKEGNPVIMLNSIKYSSGAYIIL